MLDNINIKFRTKQISTVLLVIFLIVYLISRIISIPDLFANFMVAVCGIICFLFVLNKGKQKVNKKFLILFGLGASCMMFCSIIYNSNSTIFDIIWIWSYLGVAVLMYEYDYNYKFILYIYYAFVTFLFSYILRGISAGSVLSIGSENNISTYILFILCFYFIKKKNLVLTDCFHIGVGMLVIIWTGCRGGMLALITLFFLTSVRIIYLYSVKSKRTIQILVCFVFVLFLAFVFRDKVISLAAPILNKMDRYGTTSVRKIIWVEYLSLMFKNPLNILFGAYTMDKDCFWLNVYSGNLHNSFLILHSNYGIIGFLFVAFVSLLAARKSILKKDYIVLFLLISVSIRAMFDWMAFPGCFDVIFYYLIFYILDRKLPLEMRG